MGLCKRMTYGVRVAIPAGNLRCAPLSTCDNLLLFTRSVTGSFQLWSPCPYTHSNPKHLAFNKGILSYQLRAEGAKSSHDLLQHLYATLMDGHCYSPVFLSVEKSSAVESLPYRPGTASLRPHTSNPGLQHGKALHFHLLSVFKDLGSP